MKLDFERNPDAICYLNFDYSTMIHCTVGTNE